MNGSIYNDQLSKLNKTELLDLLIELKDWYIDYKDKLEINDNKLTFGVEIEFEQARYNEIKSKVYDINVENNTLNVWELKIDQTVRSINILKENCGGEINSPIMRNTTEQWNQLKNVCEMLKLNGATAENKAGAHIHFGSQILGTDNQNWINLVKLWILYEKIIYRFSYGEKLKERESLCEFAPPLSLIINKPDYLFDMDDITFTDLICLLDYRKNVGLNFSHVKGKNFMQDNTIEIRCPNGTINHVIWQNNINFFARLLLLVKSGQLDIELIDDKMRRLSLEKNIEMYNKIYLQEALELCDLVYANNRDKYDFLKQYIKGFEYEDISENKIIQLTRINK